MWLGHLPRLLLHLAPALWGVPQCPIGDQSPQATWGCTDTHRCSQVLPRNAGHGCRCARRGVGLEAIPLCGVPGLPGQSAAPCCGAAQVWSRGRASGARVPDGLTCKNQGSGRGTWASASKCLRRFVLPSISGTKPLRPPPSSGDGSLCGCPKPLAVQLGPRSISTQGPVSLLPAPPPPQVLLLALGNTNPVSYQPQRRVEWASRNRPACRSRRVQMAGAGCLPPGPSVCTASRVCDC